MITRTLHRTPFFKPLSGAVAIILLLGFLCLTCFSGAQKKSFQAKEVQEEAAGEMLEEAEAGGVKKTVLGSHQSNDFPLHLFSAGADHLCFLDVYWVSHHFANIKVVPKNTVGLYLLYCCLKVFL